jgi:hypothetical protein
MWRKQIKYDNYDMNDKIIKIGNKININKFKEGKLYSYIINREHILSKKFNKYSNIDSENRWRNTLINEN